MKYIKFVIPNQENKNNSIGLGKRIASRIITFILPKANPDFDNRIGDVLIWMLEFENEKGFPNREVGIDSNNKVIVKMPFKKNYGYWTDNSLEYEDFVNLFEIQTINESEFLKKWNELQ